MELFFIRACAYARTRIYRAMYRIRKYAKTVTKPQKPIKINGCSGLKTVKKRLQKPVKNGYRKKKGIRRDGFKENKFGRTEYAKGNDGNGKTRHCIPIIS